MHKKSICAILVLVAALAAMPAGVHAASVDLELALLVDVSGSIDSSEYNLQMQGYVDAFNSPAVQNKIAAGNGIAVCMIQWSSLNLQSKVVDWTLLTDATSSAAFASQLASVGRASSGMTAPGSAINVALSEFAADNGFEGTREVIDVSGDGSQNDGSSTAAARNAAAAAGITINGLAIQNEEPTLGLWYENNLKTSDGFVMVVDSFEDFDAAIQGKIISEVTGAVPEPMTMAAMFMGVASLGGYIRKRRSA